MPLGRHEKVHLRHHIVVRHTLFIRDNRVRELLEEKCGGKTHFHPCEMHADAD